jgi:chromate transport protein ChrA
LAFLFGPLYYLAKGMWKKAILYTIVSLLILITLAMILEYLGYSKIIGSLHFGASAFFAMRANIDFYKKSVLEENNWW